MIKFSGQKHLNINLIILSEANNALLMSFCGEKIWMHAASTILDLKCP